MFFGSIPALVTPFAAGRVDLAMFRDFVAWQIEQGSHALVPCGTTGENATLTTDEHRQLIEAAVDVSRGRVKILAGCGSNNTAHAVELTRAARDAGADAALHVPPYYNRPNQDGIALHLSTIAELGFPIFLYNVPARTITDISVETMAELARLDAVIGVKDATGNLARVALQRMACGTKFVQLCGNDDMAMGFNAMGGVGCVSVSANVAPKLCAQFQDAIRDGDKAKALELQDRLTPLHAAMFADASPGPAKYAVSRVFKDFPVDLRSPMTQPSDAAKRAIDAALEHAGLV